MYYKKYAKEMLSYRFRLYPSKVAEKKLLEHLCRRLYKIIYLLDAQRGAGTAPRARGDETPIQHPCFSWASPVVEVGTPQWGGSQI